MKRAFGVAVWLLLLATASLAQVADPNASSPQEETVYVTRTGKAYHRDGCRHLSKSKVPMSLTQAAERYSPCKVCRPPVPGRTEGQAAAAPESQAAIGDAPPSSGYQPRYTSAAGIYQPKTVYVRGYYRKNGTYVRPHTRRR